MFSVLLLMYLRLYYLYWLLNNSNENNTILISCGARESVQLIQLEAPAFIAADLRPNNASDLNTVDCSTKFWRPTHKRMHNTALHSASDETQRASREHIAKERRRSC